MTQKINTAVIGVGYLGRFHAQKYAQLANSHLVAVVDFDFERAQMVAHECHTQAYTNPEAIIDLVDAVSIVTPTPFHYEIAKYFLENGKHVLIEKPITAQTAHAHELIALAKKNKVFIQSGHLERFNNTVKAAEKLINKPWFIEAIRSAPFKTRGSEVSVILDLMIHDLDLIFSINKSKLKKIEASGKSLVTPLIDIAKVRLEFENGSCAHISASRVSHKVERRLHVYQDDLFLDLDLDNKRLGLQNQNGYHEEVLEKGDALSDEIAAFLDAIIKKTPVKVTGEDGLLALEVAVEIENLITQRHSRESANPS